RGGGGPLLSFLDRAGPGRRPGLGEHSRGGVGLRQRRLPPGGRGGGAAAGAGPSARTDHEAPLHPLAVGRGGGGGGPPGANGGGEPGGAAGGGGRPPLPTPARGPGLPGGQRWVEIGRASCRERVWSWVRARSIGRRR